MPSYKIHSLKDSNKLSFIIEGESENSVQQKLSTEGHIVLSIEKTEVDTGKVFVFEGKKSDKTFIEGKIEAENMFSAYDVLSKEYGYTIEKLYPNSITDSSEQKKIFQELLSTFEEKKTAQKKVIVDTASKTLQKSVETTERLINIIKNEKIENKDIITAELKKLEQSTNSSTINQSLKEITKKLISSHRKDDDFLKKIKPIAKDQGIFMAPKVYFSFLQKLQGFSLFLKPIFGQEHKNSTTTKKETSKIKYEDIQKNSHIRTLIRKKYKKILIGWTKDTVQRQGSLYSTYRSANAFFLGSKAIIYLGKILQLSLVIVILGLFIISMSGTANNVFVFPGTLMFFFFIIILSLVIPGETI